MTGTVCTGRTEHSLWRSMWYPGIQCGQPDTIRPYQLRFASTFPGRFVHSWRRERAPELRLCRQPDRLMFILQCQFAKFDRFLLRFLRHRAPMSRGRLGCCSGVVLPCSTVANIIWGSRPTRSERTKCRPFWRPNRRDCCGMCTGWSDTPGTGNTDLRCTTPT